MSYFDQFTGSVVGSSSGGGGETTIINNTYDNTKITMTNKDTVSLYAGMPVYITGANEFKNASNAALVSSYVLGLCVEDVPANSTVDIQTTGVITIPSIINCCDEATLEIGKKYYLSAGKISKTPANYHVVIGTAIAANKISIEISDPIKI